MSDPRAGYVKKVSGLQDKVDRFIADDMKWCTSHRRSWFVNFDLASKIDPLNDATFFFLFFERHKPELQ